jgi:hypothetical protein
VTVEVRKAGPDDSAKITQSLFVDLVEAEQFRVVAKIAKKPGEFPKGTLGAVQASRERECFMRSRLENESRN